MATPLHFLILLVAGWLNRELQAALDYVRAENEVLRARLGTARPVETNTERRRLALAFKALPTRLRRELATLVSPATLLRWHRQLVARKYDGSSKRTGPGARKPDEVTQLVLRLAREDPNASYRNIQDKLRNLGFVIAKSTIHRILSDYGIDPSPERGTSWATFLKAHAGHICAADFINVEVLTWQGLVRYQALVVIDLETRVATFAGLTRQAHGMWCANIFRELVNDFDGFLRHKTHLILDNDPVFTKGARDVLRNAGVSPVKLPSYSPDLNAYAEHFIGSIRRELLAHVIPLGEKHLRWLLTEYIEHYNHERPHQARGGLPPTPRDAPNGEGAIQCKTRIGGLLRHYHREAA